MRMVLSMHLIASATKEAGGIVCSGKTYKCTRKTSFCLGSCFTLINLSFDEQDVLYLEAVVREALI